MVRLSLIAVTLTLPLLASAAAHGDEANPWVKPAELLRAATVTVRVTSPAIELAEPAKAPTNNQPATESPSDAAETPATPAAAQPNVIICSGVCVGKGRIITSVVASSDSRIRLTLPSGSQAQARLRVIDEYSGLTLLETDKKDLPALELATDKPAVGSGVMIASAWGAEQPVVAVGIVSANDRLLRGAMFPPLIQCDLRVTDTSAGAGLINSEGKLLGIVVATDSVETRRDGGYAVPVSHIERLLRMADRTDKQPDHAPETNAPTQTNAPQSNAPQSNAPINNTPVSDASQKRPPANPNTVNDASQNRPAADPTLVSDASQKRPPTTTTNGVIILKRQRPVVGMRLEGDEDAIFVRQITPGGPADKAGLKVGDQVLATDGVAIRSVYQAVLPSLHKQPGDTMRFRIQRDGMYQTVEVVLGGGVELPSAPRNLLSDLIQPQLQVGRDPSGAYVTRNRPGHVAEVFAPANPATDTDREPTAAEKLALLEKALDRYRQVIELQQQQIQALKSELKRSKP